MLHTDIHNVINATKSADMNIRDNAVEALGEILENKNVSVEILQNIINELSLLLKREKTDLVIESILNALSNMKYSEFELLIPVAVIKEQLSSYKGTAKEHAEYLLGNT